MIGESATERCLAGGRLAEPRGDDVPQDALVDGGRIDAGVILYLMQQGWDAWTSPTVLALWQGAGLGLFPPWLQDSPDRTPLDGPLPLCRITE